MNIQPLWDWMNAREEIRRARAAGIPRERWTRDPIFRQFRFCNVFREDDKVTCWVREHIREPYANNANLPFMLALARTINWPDTLQAIMDAKLWPIKAWHHERVAALMKEIGDTGGKVYTGAYMIRAESDPSKPWYYGTKHQYITGIVLQRVWDARKDWPMTSLQESWKWLTQFHGWGPFMAYEVITDLRHTKHLNKAPDIMTWANAGPGALRGLNRLEGRDLKAPRSAAEATRAMRELLVMSKGPSSGLIPEIKHRKLEMRDIEHSACEFDKYQRVLLGEGRPRSKYP